MSDTRDDARSCTRIDSPECNSGGETYSGLLWLNPRGLCGCVQDALIEPNVFTRILGSHSAQMRERNVAERYGV